MYRQGKKVRKHGKKETSEKQKYRWRKKHIFAHMYIYIYVYAFTFLSQHPCHNNDTINMSDCEYMYYGH